jgi:hypothetical protein
MAMLYRLQEKKRHLILKSTHIKTLEFRAYFSRELHTRRTQNFNFSKTQVLQTVPQQHSSSHHEKHSSLEFLFLKYLSS